MLLAELPARLEPSEAAKETRGGGGGGGGGGAKGGGSKGGAKSGAKGGARRGSSGRAKASAASPLQVVLAHEMQRFNGLLNVIRASLNELQAALQGLALMSASLEQTQAALASAAVPAAWRAVGYPSLRPLGSWVRDLAARVAFVRGWLRSGPPPCFELPALFFPQGFRTPQRRARTQDGQIRHVFAAHICEPRIGAVTGVLQTHARKHALAIDTLRFVFEVRYESDAAEVTVLRWV